MSREVIGWRAAAGRRRRQGGGATLRSNGPNAARRRRRGTRTLEAHPWVPTPAPKGAAAAPAHLQPDLHPVQLCALEELGCGQALEQAALFLVLRSPAQPTGNSRRGMVVDSWHARQRSRHARRSNHSRQSTRASAAGGGMRGAPVHQGPPPPRHAAPCAAPRGTSTMCSTHLRCSWFRM